MENLSVGDLFDREIEGLTAKNHIESHEEDLGKFLKPPYTFELPPNDKKLIPSDKGYDYYICRNNIATNICNAVNYFSENKSSFLAPSQKVRLSLISKKISNISLNPANRTKKEMAQIKNWIEEAYDIVSSQNLNQLRSVA